MGHTNLIFRLRSKEARFFFLSSRVGGGILGTDFSRTYPFRSRRPWRFCPGKMPCFLKWPSGTPRSVVRLATSAGESATHTFIFFFHEQLQESNFQKKTSTLTLMWSVNYSDTISVFFSSIRQNCRMKSNFSSSNSLNVRIFKRA